MSLVSNNQLFTQGSGKEYSQRYDGIDQQFELTTGIFNFNSGVNLDNGGVYSLANGITFGDGDSGIYESSANSFSIATSGVRKMQIVGSLLRNPLTGAYTISTNPSSLISPTYSFYTDTNTGLGWNSADNLQLISGGVEALRVDENQNVIIPDGDLNVTGNITSENVFIPQYAFSHTNETINLVSANVWANVTFTQENTELLQGLSHSHSVNSHIFNISESGIYEVDFDFDVEDTSMGASDIDVAGRVIFINGTEIEGSVFEADIFKFSKYSFLLIVFIQLILFYGKKKIDSQIVESIQLIVFLIAAFSAMAQFYPLIANSTFASVLLVASMLLCFKMMSSLERSRGLSK
jgi:hypothetical protein